MNRAISKCSLRERHDQAAAKVGIQVACVTAVSA